MSYQPPGSHSHPGWPRRAEPTRQAPSAQPPGDELAVWGAHGGAGTSTLTAWLQPARDLGAMPAGLEPGYLTTALAGRTLVLACRSTARSAARATAAAAAVSAARRERPAWQNIPVRVTRHQNVLPS